VRHRKTLDVQSLHAVNKPGKACGETLKPEKHGEASDEGLLAAEGGGCTAAAHICKQLAEVIGEAEAPADNVPEELQRQRNDLVHAVQYALYRTAPHPASQSERTDPLGWHLWLSQKRCTPITANSSSRCHFNPFVARQGDPWQGCRTCSGQSEVSQNHVARNRADWHVPEQSDSWQDLRTCAKTV
jgi:hypothetical protein